MFDSLDEQIRNDDHKGTTSTQRLVHWLMIAAVAAVVIGGLALGVSLMQ